jgi:hypothetical protein
MAVAGGGVQAVPVGTVHLYQGSHVQGLAAVYTKPNLL